MNAYPTSYHLTPPATANEAPATLTEICALSDQLVAAVLDVTNAWEVFRYGASAPQVGGPGAQNPNDRIGVLRDNFHEQVKQLARLAEEIRSRS